MLLRIEHSTKLSYTATVFETVFEVRMAPPSTEDQTALGYQLRTTPQTPLTSYRDGFGNRVDLFNVATPYRELVTQTTSYVRTHRRGLVERLSGVPWPQGEALAYECVESLEFLSFSPLIDPSPALESFVAGLQLAEGSFSDRLRQLMDAISARLSYVQKVTSANTRLSEVLGLGSGVCQDYTHLFIGVCRGLGLPARYVSGYINHPGEIATHAWCQVWTGPAVGWVDVDPTRGEFVGDEHVVTAVGRDYSDVPPNRGLWKGRAEETIEVTVKVESVERVPMEWNEWSAWGTWPAASAPTNRYPQHTGGSHKTTKAYPNQRTIKSGLRNQQGQQQQ